MGARGTRGVRAARRSWWQDALHVGVVAAVSLAVALLGAVRLGTLPGTVGYEDAVGGEDAVHVDGSAEGDLTDVDAAPEDAEPGDASLGRRVDAYLDENFPKTGVPGVAVAVVDSDGVRYLRTLGDCEDEHATFTIGSLSKSFTAVAIMQLVEGGKVNLDDPVRTYVPECREPDVVTVRSLLNQTSGFGYYDSLSEAWPGESLGSFSYANANYDLLGKVIECVSGQSYADYLEQHVFGPLGMDDSSARETGRADALGHRDYFGLNLSDGYAHVDGADAWGGASSGYVRSSVLDMARYLTMYLNGGEDVLSEGGVEALFFDRVPDLGGDSFYGMGWTSYYWDDGELVLSHDGQVENGVARMCLLPGRDMGIVILGDASDYFGGNDAFFQMANDIVSLAVGGGATGVDAGLRAQAHAQANRMLAVVAALALLPLALLHRWRLRLGDIPRDVVLWRLVFVHVGLPLLLWWVPDALLGARWRDLLAFVPDVGYVLAAAVGTLVVTGAAKVILLVRRRREARAGGSTPAS